MQDIPLSACIQPAAALPGAIVMALWAWLYLPIYPSPRIDGRPG